MSASAGVVGAAAAAQLKRQQDEEEENMSKYSCGELDNWEFKIVRANTAAFKNPETLKKVIAEEAVSGWVFLEKFDDYRIRFKRKHSVQEQPHKSTIDPYRTSYGISQWWIFAMIMGGVLFFAWLIIFLTVAFSN